MIKNVKESTAKNSGPGIVNAFGKKIKNILTDKTPKRTARIAGLMYLGIIIFGICMLLVITFSFSQVTNPITRFGGGIKDFANSQNYSPDKVSTTYHVSWQYFDSPIKKLTGDFCKLVRGEVIGLNH